MTFSLNKFIIKVVYYGDGKVKEKNQKITFLIFAGVVILAFALTALALGIFTIDVEIGNLKTFEKNEFLSASYSLFTFKDGIAADLPGAIEKWADTFGELGQSSNFESEIANVTNLGVMLTLIGIALGSGLVVSGFFVRVFTPKRKSAVTLWSVGLGVVVIGAIIYIIMLNNFLNDLENAFRVGLGKCLGEGNDGYVMARELFSTDISANMPSIILPIFGVVITVIFSILPFFKQIRTITYI